MTNVCGFSAATAFFLFAASAMAQAPAPDLSGKDNHWIQDPDSHCWAANPNPQEGESIKWTGACENMLITGPGVLTWYENGRISGRDEGQFKNGELSGHGRIFFEDGASFEGEFPGVGVLTTPDGKKVRAQSVKEPTGWDIEQIVENPPV